MRQWSFHKRMSESSFFFNGCEFFHQSFFECRVFAFFQMQIGAIPYLHVDFRGRVAFGCSV